MLQNGAVVLALVSMGLLFSVILLTVWPAVVKRTLAVLVRNSLTEVVTTTGAHTRLAIGTLTLFQRPARPDVIRQRARQGPSANYRLTVDATSTLALDHILQQVHDQVRQLLPLDLFCVVLRDRNGNGLRAELVVEEGHSQPGFAIKVDNPTDPIARVMRSQQPLRINDVKADGNPSLATPQFGSSDKVRAWLGLPLIAQGKVIGMLSVQSYRPNAFTVDDEQLLMPVAAQAAVAIENAWLYRESKRRLEEASIIQAVALAGAHGQPFDDIVAEATERLRRLWDSHLSGFLFPDETGALRVHDSYIGISPEAKRETRIQPGMGVTGLVFQTGQPIIVPDVRQEARYIESTAETRSEMTAPLVVGDQVIGVVNVESTCLDAFSAEDVHLLSALAGQLAIILDNVQAHRDLAERAEELQYAYNELAEAERLKDQLVQNISHELRTPMTYIRGYTELMLTETLGPLPAGLREFLKIVSQKAETVTHLIERIVVLQAVNPKALQLEPLRLSDLVKESIHRCEPQAQHAGLEVDCEAPQDLPLIAGDRKQLLEAFDSLFSNAIKFSPRGGKVRLAAHPEAESIHIQIADTGIGIPPDKLSRVFDRFYQIDGTTRRHFGGAGVGLALVRRIIEAHGGHIWAESAGQGLGSTFHLVLPIAPVTA